MVQSLSQRPVTFNQNFTYNLFAISFSYFFVGISVFNKNYVRTTFKV